MAFDHYQMREAALAAERWLALNPTSEQARRYGGVAALELHRLDAAERALRAVARDRVPEPGGGLPRAAAGGRRTMARPRTSPSCSVGWSRATTVAEGHYALGSAALRSENFALALASARRATELAPYWVPARMLLARALIASGDEQAGLDAARDLVMAPDADIATHLEYALLLAGTGREDEARAMLPPYATGETVVPGAVRTSACSTSTRATSTRPASASRTCSRPACSPTTRCISSA